MTKNTKRGWLGCLIVAFMVISPLVTFLHTYGYVSAGLVKRLPLLGREFMEQIAFIRWLEYWVSCVLSLAVGNVLWKCSTWRAVKTALVLMWVPVFLKPIWMLAGGVMYTYSESGFDTVDFENWSLAYHLAVLSGQIAPVIIFNTICTAYLLKSKRVRNTYPQLQQPYPGS